MLLFSELGRGVWGPGCVGSESHTLGRRVRVSYWGSGVRQGFGYVGLAVVPVQLPTFFLFSPFVSFMCLLSLLVVASSFLV